MKSKSEFSIVIGDKNLSSWSLRPWLVLKKTGVQFKEIKIQLDTETTSAEIKKYSEAGKVPVLIHKGLTVTDSMAICEYLHEIFPDKKLWPASVEDRALARSYAAEMHSSFQSIRSQLSMDIRLRMKINHLLPSTITDIKRVIHIWSTCLKKSNGPFLFGEFGIVDAFYAPVVLRFISYGIDIKDKRILQYMKSVTTDPDMKQWIEAANKEKNTQFAF
jgi:glutathione S-transferase